MHAATAPQFPASVVSSSNGRSILTPSMEFLAQCIATPDPWAALQDALWASGITTHVTIEAPAVDPLVDAPGATWPERVNYRRQHCRTTYTLHIDDPVGHDWKDWQTVLQWAAVHQLQALAEVKGNDAAMGMCFSSEEDQYVVMVAGGKPFDYALRDAYEPIMWKAWREYRNHPTVKVFGESIEPQDMDGILYAHLLKYKWHVPPVAVAGYITWPAGEIKGLFAATISFYDAIMKPRNSSAMFSSGHWKRVPGYTEERVSTLDGIAQLQHLTWPTTVPAPNADDLRDAVWKALHNASRDTVDDEIIHRRWMTRLQISEPYRTIAKDLGISAQAVGKRWKWLREAVRDVLPEPEQRALTPYRDGEREGLRENVEWNWQPDQRHPGRRLDPDVQSEAFRLQHETDLIVWEQECARTWHPDDEVLDTRMCAAGYAYGPDDKTVAMACGSVPRYARWGIKGVFSKLMDLSISSNERNARESCDGWGEGPEDFWSAEGYRNQMRWRPGSASTSAQHRGMVSVDKASQASEGGEAEWHVGPSVALRGSVPAAAGEPTKPAEWWTVSGLGRRGLDGPPGTESAGFGSLHIEQGPPRLRQDGRALPPMPENVEGD